TDASVRTSTTPQVTAFALESPTKARPQPQMSASQHVAIGKPRASPSVVQQKSGRRNSGDGDAGARFGLLTTTLSVGAFIHRIVAHSANLCSQPALTTRSLRHARAMDADR